jgi:hypothetical protein
MKNFSRAFKEASIMKIRHSIISLVLIMAICGLAQAAELLIENFESYADSAALAAVWKERNPTVVTLNLETLQGKDGTKSLIVDYNCKKDPYWSEAYKIYSSPQNWSGYKTLMVWVKGYVGAVPGRTANQSLENMYAVIYQAKPGYPNPIDHTQLDMLGKVAVYRATQVADWTVFRFNLAANFEPLSNVIAFGIGMQPDFYGAGIVRIDAITLTTEAYGGIINNFEEYTDTNALNAAIDVNENSEGNSFMTLASDINDANVIYGHKALKFSFNNGQYPNWSKVMFYLRPNRSIKYAWGPASFNYGMNYNPLTINFKVIDPEGRMQVVLIDGTGNPTATYKYNDGARLTAGDWTRWDINPQSVYDNPDSTYTELDSVVRVEVQFVPIDGNDYGTGLVYLDDIHVNFCGTGVGAPVVGNLRADFNQDCVIDFMDMVAFAQQWQRTDCSAANQYCNGADFSFSGSRNGKVDFQDLLVVVYRWLDCNFLYQGDCF